MKEAWKHGSLEARKQGNKEAWKQGSKEAWKQGSMGSDPHISVFVDFLCYKRYLVQHQKLCMVDYIREIEQQ